MSSNDGSTARVFFILSSFLRFIVHLAELANPESTEIHGDMPIYDEGKNMNSNNHKAENSVTKEKRKTIEINKTENTKK